MLRSIPQITLRTNVGVDDPEKINSSRRNSQIFKEEWRESQKVYQMWNGVDYENDMVSAGYKGALWTSEYVSSLNLDKSARILDICCGTGLVGALLKRNGFVNVDGLDSSAEMLEHAKAKEIYKNYYLCQFGSNPPSPIAAGQYDVVTVSGSFADGHLGLDAFDEMLRLLKVGGYVVNAMRENLRRKCPAFLGKFDPYCRALVKAKKWRLVYEHVNPDHFMKHRGLVQVYRKSDGAVSVQGRNNIVNSSFLPGSGDRNHAAEACVSRDGSKVEKSEGRGATPVEWVADYLRLLRIGEESKILVVGEGAGRNIGARLRAQGFEGVTELTDDSLQNCNEKNDIGAFDAAVVLGPLTNASVAGLQAHLRRVHASGHVMFFTRARHEDDDNRNVDEEDEVVGCGLEQGRWELLIDHVNGRRVGDDDDDDDDDDDCRVRVFDVSEEKN